MIKAPLAGLLQADVILVGAGIMSATLGVFLKELDPELKIEMFESLEEAGLESSNAWNNAGTGHAANCELNYTPEREDGSIDISKALEVNVEFDLSRQFWSYLVENQALTDPKTFIHSVPHMSFVTGEKNVTFLQKRFATLGAHHCYRGMEYTEDWEKLREWVPLVMRGRDPKEKVAATRVAAGTDVDYGSLTRSLVAHLSGKEGFAIRYAHRVVGIKKGPGGSWHLEIKDTKNGSVRLASASFVFLGAGGDTLLLLQKSGIAEIKGYAGFPVSGIWLRCDDLEISQQHHAKVYGKASVGSPPMSVPHLDTRVVEGKRSILFGPYAGFSTRFLKHGSLFDFFRSIQFDNLRAMLAVARDHVDLIQYLVGQVFQSSKQRFAALQEFYPTARREDWKLEIAGQRVQIVKPDPKCGGTLQFGTQLVSSSDRSLIGLLGASPGASTAVSIVVDLLEKCFPQQMTQQRWLPKLKKIIPSYGESLIENGELCRQIRAKTAEILKLSDK